MKSGNRSVAAAQPSPKPRRQREAADRHWLFGLHAVHAALINPQRTCRRLLSTENAAASAQAMLGDAEAGSRAHPDLEIVTRQALERHLPQGATHQGVALLVEPLATADLDDLGRAAALQPGPVLVLDQVNDPHNVGAIIRSAAAFQAVGVVVTDRHAPAMTGTLAKVASGGVEQVSIVRARNLAKALADLQKWDFTIVGLTEDAESTLGEFPLPPKTAIVLGGEHSGMRALTRESCDALVRLPTSGWLASLNVSNAAAIALYEWRRAR